MENGSVHSGKAKGRRGRKPIAAYSPATLPRDQRTTFESMAAMTDLPPEQLWRHFLGHGYTMKLDTVRREVSRLRRASGGIVRKGRPGLAVNRYDAIAQAHALALTLLAGPEAARKIIDRMSRIVRAGGAD